MAFPSYTASEVTGRVPVLLSEPGGLVTPAAVGSDGSFAAYTIAPTDTLVRPPDSQLDSELPLDEPGFVTSATYVDSACVATTDDV